jgi:acetolactate synthase-1/2/3 large subunit
LPTYLASRQVGNLPQGRLPGKMRIKRGPGTVDKQGRHADRQPGQEVPMTLPMSRRTALKALAAQAVLALPPAGPADARPAAPDADGKKTGAQALVDALLVEGVGCVFGIPGAQENELWDEMKSRGLPYLLVTHEFSAACMADGYARSTGRPGVLCVVPGPGVTNSLSGLGEALLDSVPVVAVVGDVARGDKYRPFQVHDLPQVGLLQQVTKGVFPVGHVAEIPAAVHQAFALAQSGEPGPTAVVVPYNLLIEKARVSALPPAGREVVFDEAAVECALRILSDRSLKVGIYAGLGCMDCGELVARAAELLQAPVATSVSGKGVLSECHPLAVGWGYGPQGTCTAEHAFKSVDLVLAVGVRYSEVSTAFYNIPPHKYQVQVDANPHNLGKVIKADVCVSADACLFFQRLLDHADQLRRPCDDSLPGRIAKWKAADCQEHARVYARCGVDPMAFLLALRRATCPDALVFVDVTMTEHWAAEAFTVCQPRTYFNPTDNQAMGWSIPAALGAQRAHPGRQVVTITGDGCFLMSAMEMSTAVREGLPVKFFILDDHAYHYMQVLQKQAYRRTTATILAGLDYAGLAQGLGLHYLEIACTADLEGCLQVALAHPGPILVRVVTDYGTRPCRWINAARARFTKELSTEQKVRFAARLGSRALDHHPQND